ncbi:MAG: TMEM165/GDT1 family protein [Candidatus Izemoplasma sp.]|nr:TMEM165/GDT1 family protein [Candidatus Izemoplasma sp.]
MFLDIMTVFSIIFIAELGDKSQILAMSFATKYRLKHVLIGVFIGILINHLFAVLIGIFLGTVIVSHYITYLVGVVFITFSYLTLFDRGEDVSSKRSNYGPIVTISLAFFLGELGDKTQLATMAFASNSDTPFLILFGSVSAMLFVSYLGILIGQKLGEKVPDYYIRIASSALFIGYGLMKLFEAYDATNIPPLTYTMIISLIVITYFVILARSIVIYRQEELTVFQRVAKHLHDYNMAMESALDVICLGEDYCGVCKGKDCIIGHTKFLIEQSKKGKAIDVTNLSRKIFKDVAPEDILKAIDITLEEIKDHWDDPDFHILHLIRHNLDHLLFQEDIDVSTYEEYKTTIDNYKKHLNQKI